MYKELIKNLRRCATEEDSCRTCELNDNLFCANNLMKQAADAIEELSREYESVSKDLVESVELCRKLKKPKWIPVTERLPENDDFVIVAIKDEHGDSPYVYSDFGWYFDRAECWIVDTEQRTDITHWMPLPKPPEEET